MSYLDHVRSNNRVQLFPDPTYTDDGTFIHIRRIYVATLVPQHESTFYYDEPSGHDSRARGNVFVELFFFSSIAFLSLSLSLSLSRYPENLFTCFLARFDIRETRRSLDKTQIRVGKRSVCKIVTTRRGKASAENCDRT